MKQIKVSFSYDTWCFIQVMLVEGKLHMNKKYKAKVDYINKKILHERLKEIVA